MNDIHELLIRAAELEERVPPLKAGPRTDDERMFLEKAAELRSRAERLRARISSSRRVVTGLYEETGLIGRPELVPDNTAAVLALRDRENAARLRAAGFTDAATFLETDPAVIDQAFGLDE